MRLDVVCKASRNQNISPIVLSQIDGPLQGVEVAVAELQYGDADLSQKFGMLREVWAAFIAQQRRRRSPMSFGLNNMAMRCPIPVANGALIY